GYTLGSVKTWSTGTFGNIPTDANEKFKELDFGPSDNDVRHRFTSNVVYQLPYGINVGAIVTANSRAPYNHTTGADNNLDFNTNITSNRTKRIKSNSLDSYFLLFLCSDLCFLCSILFCYAKPRAPRGGVAATSRSYREASFEERTGWSLTSRISACVLNMACERLKPAPYFAAVVRGAG